MAQLAPSNSARRTGAGVVLLCLVAIPLAQAGLGYAAVHASWPWYWLAGTPLAYLLIGGLAAFLAVGGLPAAVARSLGARLGAIGGISGAVVATLVTAAFILWELKAPQPAPSHLGPGGPAFLILVVLFLFGPAFVVVNLVGVASAMLGGLLGGALRAAIQRGGMSLPESVGDQGRTRAVRVIGVIVVALALLAGVAALLLSSGTFTVIR
ncbi:MAG TPA: hypothetical protein VF792_09770 [Ktedonobacterales bacterium]